MKKILARRAVNTTLIALAAVAASCSNDLIDKVEADVREVYKIGTVAAPVISPIPTVPALFHTVTLTPVTPGALIRYTLDGTTPTDEYGLSYSAPLTLVDSATLRAVSYIKYWTTSSMVSQRYSVDWCIAAGEASVNECAYGIVESGGAFYVAGSAGSTADGSVTNYGTSAGAGYRRVARIGKDGSLTWVRGLGQVPYNGGAPIAATPDGGVALACEPISSAGKYYTRIAKVDALGNLAWTSVCVPYQAMEFVKQFHFQAVDVLPDGGVAIGSYDYDDGRGNLYTEMMIVSATGAPSEGNGLTSCHGSMGSERIGGIAHVAENGAATAFALVGYGQYDTTAVTGGSTGIDGFAIFLDRQKAWSRSQLLYKSSAYEEALTAVSGGADCFYLAGYETSMTGVNAVVAKTSPAGVVAWAKDIGETSYDERLFGIAAMPDGGFVAVGRRGSSIGAGGDAWVFRGDASGSRVWEKTYGGSGEDAAYGVSIASDGDILVCGSTSSFGAASTNILALKLSPDGDPVYSTAGVGLGTDVATYSAFDSSLLKERATGGSSSAYAQFSSDSTAVSTSAPAWSLSRQYPQP